MRMHARQELTATRSVALRMALPLLGVLVLAGGCADKGVHVRRLVQCGELGQARHYLMGSLKDDPANRDYMYDRSMLALAEMADGLPESANKTMDDVYAILRTQGINAGRALASVVLFEHVRFWKGEPFEQALLWTYLAAQRAMIGEWDNARAAAQESLFLLKNFGELETTEKVAQEAAKQEAENDTDFFAQGYTPTESNFVLGYLMTAVSNQVLSSIEGPLTQQANERFDEAVALDPTLASLVDRFRSEPYNTVLLVDYGFGPTKIAYGMDHAFCKFAQNRGWKTDSRELHVSVNGTALPPSPAVCDVNVMAADLMWNNMEDVRVAKSRLGTALLVGGGAVAGFGRSREARMAGAVASLAGLAMKLSSRADTTHSRILAQRIYLVPAQISSEDSVLEIEVENDQNSRVVLPAVDPPDENAPVQLLYVRLVPTDRPPSWLTAGQVLYANDGYAGSVPGDDLPYILGGGCVRRPSEETLRHYQTAGYLTNMTLVDLENLYRDEGISLSIDETEYRAHLHVLEGGDTLVCPLPGSIGYNRLFCQEHAEYVPRNERCREFKAQLMEQSRPLALTDGRR